MCLIKMNRVYLKHVHHCFDYTPSTFVYVSERGRTGEGRQEREREGRGKRERERANEIYF